MSRLRNALVVTAVCAFVLTTFTHLRASTDSGVPLGGVASLTSSGGWAAANLPLSKSLDRVLRRAVNRPPAKFVPSSVALSATADAWVATDDWNYVPGETVQISAGGFAAGEAVRVQVIHTSGVAEDYAGHEPWYVSADANGAFATSWFVAPDALGQELLLTADGLTSGLHAEKTFVDANPAADLDQCANGPVSAPTTCAPDEWVNGNLGPSKSHYLEGQTIPYRMKFDNLSLGGSHTVIIEWDTTKSGKHATDYITSYNNTVPADPCAGIAGCSAFTTFPIPNDPQVTGAGVTPIAGGVFTLFGGTITGTSAYTYPDGAGFAGDKSAQIAITFTASVANPVLAWGGHIATRQNWGPGSSAVAISGSPYHMRLIDLDGSGGNQDRSLSADAIIFPGSITIIKQATPEGSQSFSFTATPNPPLSNFSLVDDGTTANTKLFSQIITFQNYTIAETVPSAWTLNSIGCTLTDANGGSFNVSNPSVTINMKEGENWTCTFTNQQQPAKLIVIKHVINDNGGTAVAANFTMNVNRSGTGDLASGAGVESPGTEYTISPGSYNVTETGPSGYDASFSTDCTGTAVPGVTKTCTVTNDDQAAHLIVIKHVINNNGGSKVASDFTTTITGVTTATPTAAGAESPGVDNTLTTVGSYSVDEGAHVGYDKTLSAGCSGTIALGQTKTCTITNDDQAAHLIVIKHVINNNGGSKVASDFSTTITGVTTATPTAPGAESPGVDNTLTTVGSYSVDEGAHVGYDKTLSADCSGTIALGQTKTCTITNDDQAAHLIVIKHVINNAGGGKVAADFTTTITGVTTATPTAPGAESPGVDNTLTTVGSYSVDEGAHVGYNKTLSADCSGTIALGETKTCTITNDDLAAHLIVIKHVINDNGGTKVAANFTTTISGVSTATPSAAGAESPGVDNVLTTVGSYSVDEGAHVGYTKSLSADCSGTIALGDTKTCTITNNDIAPVLTLDKIVVNDNGGTAAESAWALTANGGPAGILTGSGAASHPDVTSGAGFKAGTYALSESSATVTSGYTASNWSCVKNGGAAISGASITLDLGDSAACTITNDDQPGTIIIKKVTDPVGAAGTFQFVTTPAGGTPPTGWSNFTLTSGAQQSFTLNPGSYSVTEDLGLGSSWVLTGVGSPGSTNCTVNAGGTSSGTGDLATATASITLKAGDTVTCTFENTATGSNVTRTQGFWATHPQLAYIAWFGGTGFGHTFPGVAAVAGIGDTSICGRPIDTLGKLMGAFWSDISKTSTGQKRSALDQARMQLLQQLIAAELNASAFNAIPSGGSSKFADWEAAYCGTNQNAIKNAQQQAAAFNTNGDSGQFTPGTSADSKAARAIADLVFWNILP